MWRAFLLAALILTPLRADENWTSAVHGVQARLYTVPHTADSDFTYDVVVEFVNVSQNSSGTSSTIHVPYTAQSLATTITDAAGHEVASDPNGFYNGLNEGYILTLPPGGRTSFFIGSGSATALRINFGGRWKLPAGPLHLTATFSTDAGVARLPIGLKINYPTQEQHADPRGPVWPPPHCWKGELKFPALALPEK